MKLVSDTYFSEDDIRYQKFSQLTDTIFTSFFLTEALLKIFSLGFALDKGSYLQDSWNRLDFGIVVTSLVDLMLKNSNLQFVKILRVLRTLRPLRLISRNAGMKVLVTALIESTTSILNVVMVLILVWYQIFVYYKDDVCYIRSFFDEKQALLL